LSDFHEARSQPIVETTLTELAFVFVFILLVFTVMKANEHSEELAGRDTAAAVLSKEVLRLTERNTTISKVVGKYDPEDLVALMEVAEAEVNRSAELEASVQELTKTSESLNSELSSLKEAIYRDISSEEESLPVEQILEKMVVERNNLRGQNLNLRGRVLGNGLDHPPCWADPDTGEIQYVYSIVIKEDELLVSPGWPESRSPEAMGNQNILDGVGDFDLVTQFQKASTELYKESVGLECRHFVVIYDQASSKKSFKNYLLGIESHFYKYLSSEQSG